MKTIIRILGETINSCHCKALENIYYFLVSIYYK